MTKTHHTIRAMQIRSRQGKYMARQYAMKHGVMSYYRLACQLEAVKDED